MKNAPTMFEAYEIRRVYDETTGIWWFSVVDIVQVLTQQPEYQTARKYWNKLKERLTKEGSQSVTDCHRLKLRAADGKHYLTDVATAETLLRLVQSVPSPKAEPIKLWLAKVVSERMQEMADPGLTLDRAREDLAQAWAQRQMDPAAHDRPGNTQQADRLLGDAWHKARRRVCCPDQYHSPGMVGCEREDSQGDERSEGPEFA